MSFILISKLKTVITSCNGIQDRLGFLIPHHRFRIPGTGFCILRQWSLDSNYGCADSLCCILCCILDNFKAHVFHGKNFLDSRLHKQNFSRFPYMGWQWPKLNHFTIELKLVKWASNYCRRSVVPVMKWMLEMEVCGPGVFRNCGWDSSIPKQDGYDY